MCPFCTRRTAGCTPACALLSATAALLYSILLPFPHFLLSPPLPRRNQASPLPPIAQSSSLAASSQSIARSESEITLFESPLIQLPSIFWTYNLSLRTTLLYIPPPNPDSLFLEFVSSASILPALFLMICSRYCSFAASTCFELCTFYLCLGTFCSGTSVKLKISIFFLL